VGGYGCRVSEKTYLDRILSAHREAAAKDDRRLDDLIAQATAMPKARSFANALAGPGLSVIAEIKRRSPSKGDLDVGLDPVERARSYEAGGAVCLSVLTDTEFFGAQPDDLAYARAATQLPVLRKDFTVSHNDVCDARLLGADCVLLIAAALSHDELCSFHELAVEIGLAVLVEIHDEAELVSALGVDAKIIGVNQRDLVTFQVDHARAVRMAAAIPDGVIKVAESGVRTAGDARNLQDAGYHAILVGESAVTAVDPTAFIHSLHT
jgi:indole-3-glycerol phosphate synthase